MQAALRAARNFFRTWVRPVSLSALARNDRAIAAGRSLVALYYGVVPILVYNFMLSGLEDRDNFDPLWPIAWIRLFDLDVVETVHIIKLGFIAISVIGVFFYRSFFVRALVFFAIFQTHALESSFMYINHQWYTWLYTSLIMIFLPNIWEKDTFAVRRKFLLQIWFAQAMFMLTYFMAGLQKFHAVFVQWSAGEIHGLHPLAFAYQSADWIRQLQSPAPLAASIIEHPELWWPVYLSLYFVQIFALWIMVRPSLQKPWAFALIFFHFGTFLSMGITFFQQFVLVLALFIHTPFAIERVTLKQFFIDLPIAGQLYELVSQRRKKARDA